MNYKEKLEKIKTVRELYDFRDELKEIEHELGDNNLKEYMEAQFYIQRIEAQIIYLESIGMFLNELGAHKEEKPDIEPNIMFFQQNVEGNKPPW